MLIDSYSKWELLRKIVVLRIKKELSISELAHLVNKNSTDPYFQLVIKFLRENDIIIYTRKIGTAQFIKITNKKKLLNLTWNVEYVDNVMELMKIKYPMGVIT